MKGRIEVPPESDPDGENARWRAALAGLKAIRDDPAETPARRDRAAIAIMSAYGRGGAHALQIEAPPSGGAHNHTGGAFLATLAVEQGWDHS